MATQEAIKPHLADGETINSARASGTDAIVVTDRRILDIKQHNANSGREHQFVNSTLFTGDNVAGVRITEIGKEPVDIERILLAVFVGIGGVIAGFLANEIIPDIGNLLAVFIGLTGLAIAVAMTYEAFQTEDGHIKISLLSLNGDTFEALTLAEDEADVAASISEAVGNAHPA
ncbi:hypothetical protein C2R22_21335 (plasmid) [Salinigranum rubrum]|uniref:Uncharacterized protein n=1 Tax=Salinigranum rubrum TaxID=755307 RepID=A0A2I8VQC3_9EURY|nr:hypothetical protein [Salinigranum rubrum]AUV84127.1 hypothetical protein C2R22_21335 [Salinigranum rubrum]